MDPLSLDADTLVEEAREKAGLQDFGDESFREPLGVLLDSLENEAKLNDIGRGTQHGRIVDSLATRLMTEDYIRRHPEILEEDLGEAIVIVGLARTGTTRLHRLLGSGPAFQVAQWWEVRYPAPFAGSDWRSHAPRIAAAHAEVKATLEAVPALATVHPWDPEGADEEVMLLEHTFLSWVPESGAHVPSYQRWLDDQDLTEAYRYLARFLRFIQWQKKESGRGGGRWILKSPFHLAYVDPPWGGEAVRSRYRDALERCMRAREKYAPERFIDVDYRAVGRDAIGEARRIYEWLGVELTGDAERAMRQWSQENARERRAAHEYTLEEFGFTRDGLASDFAEYRERHILD